MTVTGNIIINSILSHLIYKIELNEKKEVEFHKLYHYCCYNQTELAVQLISEGYADVTKLDNNKNTLFIICASNDNTIIMNKLLDTNKINIYYQNKYGYSALYFIKMNQNEKILKKINIINK